MPVTIRKKGKCWTVKTPSGTKAKCTTKKKAEAQKRLLQAVDHGFKPTGAPARKRMKKKLLKKYE